MKHSMKHEIDPKVKEIMKNAVVEAKNYDDTELRPEHIMLSVIQDSNNLVIDILKGLKVDIDKIFTEIGEYLYDNHLEFSSPFINEKKVKPSKLTQYIISQMDDECLSLNDEIINECHLMLGILKTSCPTRDILKDNKLTYKNFKTKVMGRTYDSSDEENEQNERPGRIKKDRTKTPALDSFCVNISKAAENGAIDPVVGREAEIKRVSAILSRRKKNNPVLIGEAGVGKTSIVEGLAMRIHEGEAPPPLLNKQIYSLDLASIVAGTKYRGQFEERMKAILKELKDHPEIIIFVDELHTMVGAGNASGSLDASNILKPALARSEIQCIGATTLDEYRENIEKDGALTRRFQEVMVREPSLPETITILTKIRSNYEKHHKVKYSDEIIKEIVKLSDRYISARAMPDKAIDVMDEVGAAKNVEITIPGEIKKLKSEIFDIQTKKFEVVKKQKYEEAAKLRETEVQLKEDLEGKTNEWESELESDVTDITSEMVRTTLSRMTGIPLTKLTTTETNSLKNIDKDLKGLVIGQDDAVDKVARAIKRSRLGIKNVNKPIGSFIFLGPTGVGKTYLAKVLAEKVFMDSDALIRVDMTEYMEKHSMAKLIGAPPGYVGYGEGGKLTEAVRRKPYSVILFDEIEKAHEEVFNLLLQMLDEGHLTDSNSRKVDFKNTLIILTSNIGVKKLQEFGTPIGFETDSTIINESERNRKILVKALKDKFKPEFLNRIDETIIFNSLTPDDIKLIINHEINHVKTRIAELGYSLTIQKSAIEYLVKEGYDKDYGARPLTRAIQKYVEDPIADAVMDGKVKEGDNIKISYSEKNGITVKVS